MSSRRQQHGVIALCLCLFLAATYSSSPSSFRNLRIRGREQIQGSHASLMNRYPEQYEVVREYLATSRSDRPVDPEVPQRLLSFGSATGEEPISLATMYFPNKKENNSPLIFGVDLHRRSIETAIAAVSAAQNIPEGKVTFFNGKYSSISEYGPYDAIFANSVLCYYPQRSAETIVEWFPFESFESSLEYLDDNLKVGGVLAIANTNYHFSRTQFSSRYAPLDAKCEHFVPKVDPQTAQFEHDRDLVYRDYCAWVKIKAKEDVPGAVAPV